MNPAADLSDAGYDEARRRARELIPFLQAQLPPWALVAPGGEFESPTL
jgi:hypothetical protein